MRTDSSYCHSSGRWIYSLYASHALISAQRSESNKKNHAHTNYTGWKCMSCWQRSLNGMNMIADPWVDAHHRNCACLRVKSMRLSLKMLLRQIEYRFPEICTISKYYLYSLQWSVPFVSVWNASHFFFNHNLSSDALNDTCYRIIIAHLYRVPDHGMEGSSFISIRQIALGLLSDYLLWNGKKRKIVFQLKKCDFSSILLRIEIYSYKFHRNILDHLKMLILGGQLKFVCLLNKHFYFQFISSGRVG